MYTLIELLKDKNFCLEKFYKTNEAELDNFRNGEFEGLEEFYKNREGLLKIVKKIDDMVGAQNSQEMADSIAPDMKQALIEEVEYRNYLVSKILEQDLEILSAIETAKSQIIKDLTQVRTTKKALGSYKSGKARSRFNEEA